MFDKRNEQLKGHELEKSSGEQSYKNELMKIKKCSVILRDLFIPDKVSIVTAIKDKVDNPDKCDHPKTKKSMFNSSDSESSSVSTDENLALHKKTFCAKRYKKGKDKHRWSKQVSTEQEDACPTKDTAKNLHSNKGVVENRNAVEFDDIAFLHKETAKHATEIPVEEAEPQINQDECDKSNRDLRVEETETAIHLKRNEQLRSHESGKSSGEQSYKNQQKKIKKCSVMNGLSDLFVPDKFSIGKAIKRKMDNPDKCDHPKTKKSKFNRSDSKSSPVTTDENFTRRKKPFCAKRCKNGKDKHRRSKQASAEQEDARPIEDTAQNLRVNKGVVVNKNAVKFDDTASLHKEKAKHTTEIPVKEAEPRISQNECDKKSCSQSESEKNNRDFRVEETEKQINKNDQEENYTHAKDENAFHKKYTFDYTKRLDFSGFVYLGTRKKDRINVAVKFVRKNDELTKYYQCENCLKDKHNQNSVYFNIYDIYETESLCIYIMEYREGYLNLPTYISKVGPLPEWNTFKMFKKIKEAAEILKIAIKPENVMVNTITEEIKINETNECCSFWHRGICEEPKCIFQTCARKNSENSRAHQNLDEKGNAVKCDDIAQDKLDKESWSQSKSEKNDRDLGAGICQDSSCIFQAGVGKESEENIVRSLGLNLAHILGLSYWEDWKINIRKFNQGNSIKLPSSIHLVYRCLEEKSGNRISLIEILYHPWYAGLGLGSYIFQYL